MSLPFIRCFTGSKNAAGFADAGWRKAGQRRRRYYRLTPAGKKILAAQRDGWREFVEAISRITGIQHA